MTIEGRPFNRLYGGCTPAGLKGKEGSAGDERGKREKEKEEASRTSLSILKILSTKSETLNKSQILMFKILNRKKCFEHLNLGF